MKLSRKRLLIGASGATAIAAVATLATGLTFGLFSAVSPTQTNTFAAGTVTLAETASTVCTVTAMEAGDQSSGYSPVNAALTGTPGTPCTFAVNYEGTIGAFIGVAITATPTTGGLYNGTPTGLQFEIRDGAGTAYTTSGAINTNTTTPLAPLYVSTDPAGTTGHTFTVNYALPESSTVQGLSTTLTITVYAVQDSNNGSAAACTKGMQCAGITAWS